MAQRPLGLDGFLARAHACHGNRYDYSRVAEEYVDTKQHVTIGCPEHGLFRQTPNAHGLLRAGCPACGMRAMAAKNRQRTAARWAEQRATCGLGRPKGT